MVTSPVPDVGEDLMAVEAEGYFDGLPADRLMATLELLRHREVSVQQAALLIGISTSALISLLSTLPIADLQQIAQNV